MGGYLGVLLLGLFGTTAVNANGANGLFYGDASFFMKEFLAATITAVYAFVFTYASLWLINLVTPVRVSEEGEQEGLDMADFGEEAYI